MYKLNRLLYACNYYMKRFGIIYLLYKLCGYYLDIATPYCRYKTIYMQKKYYEQLSQEELKREIEELYKAKTGKNLNLNSPLTLNEKMQWLKVYDITENKKILSDKYTARKYIEECAGKEHMVELLGIYSDFSDIDFKSLPKAFVIKSSQGAAENIIVKDKKNFNMRRAEYSFTYWLKTDYQYCSFEFQYDNTPMIIIEKYLGDSENLCEYKFMCFNGEPEFFWVRSSEKGKLTRNFYDMYKKPISFKFGNAPEHSALKILTGDIWNEMICIVRKLAKPFKLVRIDTYVTDKQFYIGELTFMSGSGYDDWHPEADERKYGDMILI